MDTLENKRVLAIGAHPVDMEQFCGGTLALFSKAGWNVTIAALTDGACGSHTKPAEEIVEIRKKEAEIGAKMLGANYKNLGIVDGSVEYNLETCKKIVALMGEVNPAIIFTHPTVDYMADHAHTGQLVLWAVPESTHANFDPNDSTQHLIQQPYVYHCDPQGLIGLDGQIVRVNTIVDISSVIDQKLEAFSAHESQIDLLAKGAGINALEKTRRWAATRGQQARVMYGEGFCQQLLEQYPRRNILLDILGEKVFTL